MEEKSLFDTFPKMEDARELIDLLEEEQIEFSIIDNAFDVDITFTGNRTSSIQLFIHASAFDRVNKLIETRAEQQVDLTDKTHYLYKFSTEELYQILEKKDEWSSYDHAFAKKLLELKGEDVSDEKLKAIRETRNKQLDTPEKSSHVEILIGYLCAILGGLLGILIGWYLWKSKKTATNGDKVFAYSENDRKHGKNIAVTGIIVLSGYFIYRIVIFVSQIE